MQTPLDRRAALKLAAGACLVGPFTGEAAAQPPPMRPGAKPGDPPPVMAPPNNIVVPNAPSPPSTVEGRSLEDWIKEIDNSDPSVREHAIRVVLEFGVSARKAIPAITRQVQQLNDISPQATAIIALAELLPLAPPVPPGGMPDEWTTKAVNALISVLGSSQAVIRFRAATTFGWIGPPARSAVNSLIGHIEDRMSWEIRKAACFALGSVGRDEQGYPMVAALEALAKGVNDRESKGVRLEALQSVMRLGPPLPPASAPRLVDALNQRLRGAERDKVVLLWVRVAIMALDASKITDKELLVIAREIKSNDADLRSAAVRAIGLMGPAAKSRVQDLIDGLQTSPDPVLHIELCRALGRMGQHAERAIPSLETLSSHKEEAVKIAAGTAIQDIRTAIDTAKAQLAPPKK